MKLLSTFIPFVSLVSALFGAVMICLAVYGLVRATKAQSWIVTQGTILSVREVLLDTSGGRPGDRPARKAEVRYAYAFGEKSYESDRVWFNRLGGDRRNPVDVSTGRFYSSGQTVQVFVNPADPNEAVLSIDRVWPALLLAAGVALVAVWIVQLYFFRRSPA